jgi:protein phosphatase
MAECLVERAAAHGGRHNVSACVARIEALPAERDSDIVKSITTLPVITPPEPGTTLDGFQIESLVHKSRLYRLYKAVDTETGGKVVLKFPNPRYARDETFADNFLREEWIGKRVHSPHLVKALPLRTGRRSALYLVLGYHPGESLAERIKRKRALSVTESLYLMRQLLAALKDLHRQGVVHRDVRPKNILVDKKHKHLLLLGLGESQIDRLAQHTGAIEPSANVTSYMAPELFNAEGGATPQSDLFSAGVTLFRMLTGHYPYGRIQPTDSAPHGEMIGPRHYRKSLPPWLDALLHQACATNPARRFQTAEEFLAALNDGELPHAPSKTAASTPASATSRLWQIRHWELILVGALVVALMLYLAITFR